MAFSIARCSNCRHAVINAFISSAILPVRHSIRPRRIRNPSLLASTRGYIIKRSLHSVANQQQSVEAPETEDNDIAIEQPWVEEDHDGMQKDASTPWYLQVDTPQRETNPLLERQQLPELPSDPPPLLKPMLEHISVDIGLDDLTLFDLRYIDPPPALGANLIMVLGTARSEKHLHVSADRFCRWLKTTHKLSPYADGLLGRGELKLKLRRKAKRARLLSNVGSSETSNADDGIRTGWICVNVGHVSDGRGLLVHKDLHDDYVGFGEDVGGANVVIQMLTQEKREELDLEGLWGKMMRRQERKEIRISEGITSYQQTQEVGQHPLHEDHTRSDSSFVSASRSRQPTSYQQARAYSTVVKSKVERKNLAPQFSTLFQIENVGPVGPSSGINIESTTPNHPHENVHQNQSSSKAVERLSDLQRLFDNVRTLPAEKAQEILGQKSSSFWTSFDGIYPLFPNIKESEIRLSVLCYAHEVDAASGKDEIVRMVREIEVTFVDIPESVFVLALKTILKSDTSKDGHNALSVLSQESLYHAAELLEHMSLRGHDIATDEIRTLMQVAILQASSEPTGDVSIRKDALQRFRRLMGELIGDPASVVTESEVLRRCADAGDWNAFWDVWRSFARAMRPRPKGLYIMMFRCIAQRGHQTETMHALREWVPEMAYEEPPVAMDLEVATAIKACLYVAEPNIAKNSARHNAFGEWAHLWRRCNRATLDQ
ncbi:MAG: hypothetical protein Q9164_006122 [Protoblastenia rupestris]